MIGAAPMQAQVQQAGAGVDDVLRRAQAAWNDFNYARADSLARSVLALGQHITPKQSEWALMVIAAAAYPDDSTAQRPVDALRTLRQIVRTNLRAKLPPDLTWSGLDSLAEIAKRTTYGIEVLADTVQTVVGPTGMAALRVRSSLRGRFHLTILSATGDNALVADSLPMASEGEFRFSVMRGERPVFATGEYQVIVTGTDSATKDLVTQRFRARVETAALTFTPIPASIDSSKLLPERSSRFGFKSMVPALLVGGGAYALSSLLRPQDGSIKDRVATDNKGMAVGGALAVVTIVGGFADRGRRIPANIAANKAYAAEFAKAAADVHAENRRRVAELQTVIRFDLEAR